MQTQLESTWINSLNGDIDLHPLQFANCKRLNENKAVYLFDEVGSGKTISSGIMALEYLEQNPTHKVLVITTNALAQSTSLQPHGQFLGDWFDLLPFIELGYDQNVMVVNNHYSKFKDAEEYGLVIIDEAHLFLNESTQRYQNLTNNISATKVIFLTATPIKESTDDLNKYVTLASSLIQESLDNSWIENLTTIGKNPSELISSQFSLSSPVTRYFKDTIKALNHEGFDEKLKPKRYEVLTWEYNSAENKNSVLANKLLQLYKESANNKFVIFTRYIDKEVNVIATALKEVGFYEFDENNTHTLTYAIVTGENREHLSRFSKNTSDKLPTVLILTYQISEQGVNLPGFNYIINYHISSFPSALEQRYGRIDRINSNHTKIYNCFLIQSTYFDTNTFNFYSAIHTSIHSLLHALPSRNTLLSKETLKHYMNKADLVEKYVVRMKDLMSNQNLEHLYSYLVNEAAIPSNEYFMRLNDNEILRELVEFTKESQIELDTSLDEAEQKKQLSEEIENHLKDIERQFKDNVADKDVIQELLSKDESIWNQIFYSKNKTIDADKLRIQIDLDTADAINDCAKTIEANNDYKHYVENFNEAIRFPLDAKKIRASLNLVFEQAFIENNFDIIFPHINFKEYIDVIPNEYKSHFTKKEIDTLIPTLPFFKMVNEFKNELIKISTNKDFSVKLKYENHHHFLLALRSLALKDLKLSQSFYDAYFEKSKIDSLDELFKIEKVSVEGTDTLRALPWLKLVYQVIGIQSIVLYDASSSFFSRTWKLASPDSLSDKLLERTLGSLFHHMVFDVDYRSWSKDRLIQKEIRQNINLFSLKNSDYWTKTILNDMYFQNIDLEEYNLNFKYKSLIYYTKLPNESRKLQVVRNK